MTEPKKDIPHGHTVSQAASRRDVLFALASAWSSSGRPGSVNPSLAGPLSIADADTQAARTVAAPDRTGRFVPND